MPPAISYLEPNNKDRVALGGKEERDKRRKEYETNLEYYSGKHPQWLIQQPSDPVNDNITINVTKEATDRTLSFLFPELPLFQLDPNNSTPEEKWLNDAWMNNGGAYTLALIAQNGALAGHNYVKVLPRPDYPRVVPLNPSVPITFWKADDPDTVIWHELKWTVGTQEMLQDVINNNGSWTIREFTRKQGSQYWRENKDAFTSWNSIYPPVIAWPHLPNPNNYYGLAEITQTTRDLNDSINRVASDIGKILRYHASPRTIGIGVAEQDIISTEVNGFFTVENENAQIKNLEMQSDLASSMNFLNFLNEAYLTLSRVVVMKGTIKDFQRVTNTGIRAVFFDMLSKNAVLRWTYGRGLQAVCLTILSVAQKVIAFQPSITWPDPLPADPLETVNRYAIEQANGWNNPITISQSLGYEWNANVKNWEMASKYTWIRSGQASRLAKTSNSNSSQNNQNLDTGGVAPNG